MNQLRQLSTRRGRITLVLITIVLIAIALGGIIMVVSVARRYSLVAAGALITAWATLISVGIAQLVAAWLATERARVDTLQAAERAQVEALQAYLKEMGELLSSNPGLRDQAAADNDDLRTLARAHTLTVLSSLNPARQELVINYLREVHLLDVLKLYHLYTENQRAEAKRELAEQRAQDEVLQAYLDLMSSLLLERDLRESEEDSEVRTLARAQTLMVLSRLDPSGKTAVIEFLAEAALIQRVEGREPILRLGSADLSTAYLRRADLCDADLSGTNLSGAILSYANLRYANLFESILITAYLIGANLWEANLSYARLRYADLSYADLSYADLSRADLSYANLSQANLITTNLSGAILIRANLSYASLSYANLIEAVGLTDEQMAAAESLEGVTMPNGQKYEDWLKSKGSGKD